MKSINTMKILKENRREDIFKIKNDPERKKMEKMNKFIEEYIVPEISRLNLKEEICEFDFELDVIKCVRIIESFDFSLRMRKLFFGEDYDYLGTATPRSKKRIARDYVEVVYRRKFYYEKVNQYKEEYIIPILEKLVQDNVIIYDRNALDNKTKISTKRIDKLVDKFIKDSLYRSVDYPWCRNSLPTNFREFFGCLFNDNIEAKQDFANLLYDFINENINSIDFKKLDENDFGEYTGAKLRLIDEDEFFENLLQKRGEDIFSLKDWMD